jgi:hypothetical protein
MLKNFNRLFLLLALAACAAFGQVNTLTATTLSSAVLSTDSIVNLTSATGVNAYSLSAGTIASELYVIAPGATRGEVMSALSISGTAIKVRRGLQGARTGFPSGSAVLIGNPNWFYDYSPSGSCTAASTFVAPWVNTKTGEQWLCSTITLSWVPGFQNPAAASTPEVTAVVASVAGATAVNGPLQHISGTNAITSFTMGAGWNGGGFCVIPDGAFTTTATNNILKASTAVATKTLCFTYDATNSGFTPSY